MSHPTPLTLEQLLESPPEKGERVPIYDGRVVKLGLELAVLPDGQTFPIEIVRHSGAAAVVPLLEDGRVLLIRQYRHAAGGMIMEIPAGRLEPGEAPIRCAARELAEETGYRAEQLEPLLPLLTTPGFCDETIHLFVATGLEAGEAHREADEHIELLRMSWPEILEAIAAGRLQDGKTLVGLVSAAMKLGVLTQGTPRFAPDRNNRSPKVYAPVSDASAEKSVASGLEHDTDVAASPSPARSRRHDLKKCLISQ